MIYNDRLLEIKEELSGSKEFFERILKALPGDCDPALKYDLSAAPEFFEEIADIVGELMEHRNLTEYKRQLRIDLPELSNSWARREDSVVRQIWKDVVGLVRE